MNAERKEELLVRWMDGALSEEELRELEPILAESPELEGERKSFLEMQKTIRSAIPREVEPPYPDFFDSHLRRLITEDQQGEEPASARPSGGLSRLWLWWMAPAATAAIVAAFLLGMKSARSTVEPLAEGPEPAVYSPLESVSTEVIVDPESKATLLVVEGLEPLTDHDLAVGDGSLEGEHGFFVNTKEIY